MRFFLISFLFLYSLYALDTESSYPYLSGYTWLYFSDWRLTNRDFGRDYTENFNPEMVKCGDTVFVDVSCLKTFAHDYLPKIQNRFILITSNYGFHADDPIPGRFGYILEDDKVAAWFVQNIDQNSSEKLIPIPIGITSKCFPIGNTRLFDQWIPLSLANTLKPIFMYLNFTFDINRVTCYHYFHGIGAKFEQRKPFENYLKDLSETIFVVSPPGNGLDCHRTWESLLMGCYPIVLSSTLNPLYENLPVVIVEDWEEVTEEFLKKKYLELKGKPFLRDKLYAAYWFQKVREVQAKVRSYRSGTSFE